MSNIFQSKTDKLNIRAQLILVRKLCQDYTNLFLKEQVGTLMRMWTVENYILETKMFNESHIAEHLANDLNDSSSRWNLSRNGKGPAVTTDNASNVVRAVQESCLSPHVGCFAHTLILSTPRSIKVSQVDRLLGRVRRVITFFHKSTSATSSLKLMQQRLGVSEHSLLQDVSTRWNSSYDMCERYLEQQASVYAALIEVKNNVKDLVTLSEIDVQNLEDIVNILKPIKTVTTMMCSQRHHTVSLIHPQKEMLLKHLVIVQDDNTLVQEIISAIRTDLAKRYTDKAVLRFLMQAPALDPRFKSLSYSEEADRSGVYDNMAKGVVDCQSEMEVKVKTETVSVQPTTSSGVTNDPAGNPDLPTLTNLEDEPPVKKSESRN